MKYTLDQLKNTFPHMSFTFLQHNMIQKLLHIVEGRLVGGVVRDSLLGITTNDLDMATSYEPHLLIKLLEDNGFHPVSTGIEYGTISLFFSDYKVEITSLRKDVKSFGRKAEVEFGGTWEDDSLRRDFTFNGLFLSIEENNIYIYDYHNGLEDLKNGIVKFIGNYEDRIREDYLRILRFVRFFIRYSKNQDYTIYKEIFSPFISQMILLSMERVIMELESITKAENWQLGMEIINYFQISTLFFHTDLLEKNVNIIRGEEVLIYTLSSVSPHIIKNLPINRKLRNNILWYQLLVEDFSPHTIYEIWHKTKDLSQLNRLLVFYSKINSINYKLSLQNNEDFQKFHSTIPLVHSEGIERGVEEKNIKILFIKKYILHII